MADHVSVSPEHTRVTPRHGASRWMRGAELPAGRLPCLRDDRERVTAVLAGIEERPGRPLAPAIALSVYDQVEWLTRTEGVLFARFARIGELTEAARARLSGTRIVRVTVAKVAAVVRRLVAAGWLAEHRKTARQAVFVVATAGAAAGAVEPPVTPTASSPSGEHARVDLDTCSSSRRVWAAVRELIDVHRPVLACRGVAPEKAAGAWARYLHARLREVPPGRLERDVVVFGQAIAAMATADARRVSGSGHRTEARGTGNGRAWLSDAGFIRALHTAAARY